MLEITGIDRYTVAALRSKCLLYQSHEYHNIRLHDRLEENRTIGFFDDVNEDCNRCIYSVHD